MSDLILTDGQRRAVDVIKERYERKEPLTVISGAAGTGKALPVNMIVPTPSGKRRFGDLKVGDFVFGLDGKPTKITGVFPQGALDAYKIRFSNGRDFICSNDHLWGVFNSKGEYSVKPLSEIRQGEYLPNISPVERESIDFPLSPFLVGFLVRTGSAKRDSVSDLYISTRKNSLIPPKIFEEMSSLGVAKMRIREHRRNGNQNRFSKDAELEARFFKECGGSLRWQDIQQYFPNSLKKGVSERTIPPGYLRGSVVQRVNLLEGIIAGGVSRRKHVGKASSVSITVSANRTILAYQIGELCASLGVYYTLRKGPKGSLIVEITFNSDQYLRLNRKFKDEIPEDVGLKENFTRFRSIEPTGEKVEMNCISVEAEDKLFLAEHYIPTHNTTVVNTIIEELDIQKDQVLFATYTGKAAKVLQGKGIPAKTIHRSFYSSKLITKKGEEPYFEHTPLSGLEFNGSFPNKACRLVVLDEASMVPGDMLEMIKAYKVPIICLGDNYQLGPIENEAKSSPFGSVARKPGVAQLLKTPDVELTEIMRQAQGSGIIEVGQMLRQGIIPRPGDYGDDMKIITMQELHVGYLKWADQVLVAKNTTRKQYNNILRGELGFSGKTPMEGEKLICLKNCWEAQSSTEQPLINGATVIVDQFSKTNSPSMSRLRAFDMADGGEYYGIVSLENFGGRKRKTPYPKSVWDFDFGYAISIWKSQGSQWPKVLVVGEYNQYQTQEEYTQMLYTAITRAEKGCLLVLPF